MTDHKAEWVLVPRHYAENVGYAAAMLEASQSKVDQINAPPLRALCKLLIAAAPAASEGEDGAVAWAVISPDGDIGLTRQNPDDAAWRARVGEDYRVRPLVYVDTRPAAQVAATPKQGSAQGEHSCPNCLGIAPETCAMAATPKHDEGRDLFDAAYEAAHESKQGKKGICRYWWNAALATQPAAVIDECGRPMTYWGGKSAIQPAECVHEWVDARNQYVTSGEVCLKCHSIRAQPAERVSE